MVVIKREVRGPFLELKEMRQGDGGTFLTHSFAVDVDLGLSPCPCLSIGQRKTHAPLGSIPGVDAKRRDECIKRKE